VDPKTQRDRADGCRSGGRRAARRQGELQDELALPRPMPCRGAGGLIWRQPWMTVARDTYISALLACQLADFAAEW
jgi:hypothetical protein